MKSFAEVKKQVDKYKKQISTCIIEYIDSEYFKNEPEHIQVMLIGLLNETDKVKYKDRVHFNDLNNDVLSKYNNNIKSNGCVLIEEDFTLSKLLKGKKYNIQVLFDLFFNEMLNSRFNECYQKDIDKNNDLLNLVSSINSLGVSNKSKFSNREILNIERLEINYSGNIALLISNDINIIDDLMDISKNLYKKYGIYPDLVNDLKVLNTINIKSNFKMMSAIVLIIIERIFRDTYLFVKFKKCPIIYRNNLILGNLLNQKDNIKCLEEVFTTQEIDILEYLLNNSNSDKNYRNTIVHNNIKNEDVDILKFSAILGLLIFILLKLSIWDEN